MTDHYLDGMTYRVQYVQGWDDYKAWNTLCPYNPETKKAFWWGWGYDAAQEHDEELANQVG